MDKKKLKIGGIIYAIVEVEPSQIDEEGQQGMVDFKNSVIYINKELNKEQKEVTLIHEIIHCINSQLDETTVEFLAQSLYQVIKDNDTF